MQRLNVWAVTRLVGLCLRRRTRTGFQQDADEGHESRRNGLHAGRRRRQHRRLDWSGWDCHCRRPVRAPLADKIQAAPKDITDKPIRFIINTHYHGDHTGGNAYFQKQAPIIAHYNVRKRLESGGTAGNGSSVHVVAEAQPKDALPILTSDHDVTVRLNGEDIRALHIPAGHTDGDGIIFFPKSNVVHMGDDFVTYGFPFIDVQSGGSVNGMIDGVEKVIAQVPADVGYAGRGRSRHERREVARSDEASQAAPSLEKVFRRLRQRRCIS
jgi:glyoxylase-like metal-dependent hydrolase (beta-lactamase superfamily II)